MIHATRALAISMATASALLSISEPVFAGQPPEKGKDQPFCSADGSDRKSATQQNVDPTYPVSISHGPYHFEIPYAYLRPWPLSVPVACIERSSSFGIQFWTISLDAPEADQWPKGILQLRPTEKKVLHRDQNQFVAQIIDIKYDEQNIPPRKSNIDISIDRLLRDSTGEGYAVTSEYGLKRIIDLRYSDAVKTYLYRDKDNSILMGCYTTPLSYCQSFIILKDMGLEVRVDFPISVLSNYGDIVSGVRTLLNRWKRA